MVDIIHRIGIKGSPSEVYRVLTTNEGLSQWWTTDTTDAGDVGSTIKFRFNGDGPDFKVIGLEENALVHWKHSGEIPEPWIDTEISFQLTQGENQTYLLFLHSNWQTTSEFMAHCSMKWATFLLSLKNAIETGTGQPFPNDLHIDHDDDV